MSTLWWRLVAAAVVIATTSALAKVVDARMSRRDLAPETATRYRVLRRTVFATIVLVGILSALLVIPHVRAIAGGILASSAVLGLVIGFAAQRTIGNFVAGLMIAFTQPVRLGDEIEVQGTNGIVEEIGLTYTWLRTRDNNLLVIPNEKLASEALVNSTIRSSSAVAEILVRVPVAADLRAIVTALEVDGARAYVTALGADDASIAVRRDTAGLSAEEAASELRLVAQERLVALGILPRKT
ncbi:MAG: mechanosensitive ion channel [Actinobacteria bacterium]|uniref:Unannotated protein n=1 Tax=freshwater metagenome TaxID=449393 RepID=A0A6J6N9I4_9ZZZZ|nr:mechanosensitive ion channel [Actinomycetota bacterium]